MQVFAITVSVTVTLVALALVARTVGRNGGPVAAGPAGGAGALRPTRAAARPRCCARRSATPACSPGPRWASRTGSCSSASAPCSSPSSRRTASCSRRRSTSPGCSRRGRRTRPFVELIALLTLLGILALIAIRQASHPRRPERKSRFAGSNMWQAYYVEATVLAIAVLILTAARRCAAPPTASRLRLRRTGCRTR